MEKIKNYYSELPQWAKGVLIVGVTGIAFIVGRTIYLNARKRRVIQTANKAAVLAQAEIKEFEQQGVRATYTDSQYEAFSQSLIESMNGCGTNEEQIYEVFKKMKNDIDIRKLISIFGIRFYRPCEATQPISYVRWQFNDEAFGGSLATYLTYELTSSEIREINSILKANNVNYVF
jgi:hypothetical protein